ncbi:transmembrane protein C1orf162 homolog [Puma concolor]|uniref:Transmembrane protein C1orf162 homolog n=1 Tax=Puma concolor TaxID=9696 RepID=A0A6P6IRD7_PUMCO|nr:transmembrane protein C1orf162 homolog [Puma concolor]
MGGGHSKPECNNSKSRAGTVTCPTADGPSRPFLCQNSIQYLLLAFFAGVLLTLLLLALIFFIIKSYRKRHSSPCALDPPFDPHSGQDPPAKLSSPEEALTYASMTFQIAEKNHHLTEKHSAGLDPVVYSQIKVTNSPDLSSEA